MGVQPLLGRAISQEYGRPGGPPVFGMNYRLGAHQSGRRTERSMPNGKASTGPDSGPGIYHNTSMVMSVALRHRTSGAGCAARRKSVSRGFDGFEIDDFRD